LIKLKGPLGDIIDPFLQERKENFVGREWIFKKVSEWRKNDLAKPILLVTGPPGIGKSAAIGEMCLTEKYSDQLKIIAFSSCQSGFSITLDPMMLVEHLYFEMKRKLQFISPIEEDLKIYREKQDASSFFELSVLKFFRSNETQINKNDPYLICIDGLDEALGFSGKQSIVELIHVVREIFFLEINLTY
jgi:DNA polymerase III delta prime subunit